MWMEELDSGTPEEIDRPEAPAEELPLAPVVHKSLRPAENRSGLPAGCRMPRSRRAAPAPSADGRRQRRGAVGFTADEAATAGLAPTLAVNGGGDDGRFNLSTRDLWLGCDGIGCSGWPCWPGARSCSPAGRGST